MVPRCQINSAFPEPPLWHAFYGCMLMALLPDGHLTFTALDLSRLISEEYQMVACTRVRHPYQTITSM